MSIGMIIQGYAVIASANGYVIGRSSAAPSPYVVWQVDHSGEGVSCGHYFVDREEAEWDFCARAFEWFEDNMYIHMIEDNPPNGQELTNGLRALKQDIAHAARLVDEMCAIVDKLKEEGRRINGSSDND